MYPSGKGNMLSAPPDSSASFRLLYTFLLVSLSICPWPSFLPSLHTPWVVPSLPVAPGSETFIHSIPLHFFSRCNLPCDGCVLAQPELSPYHRFCGSLHSSCLILIPYSQTLFCILHISSCHLCQKFGITLNN